MICPHYGYSERGAETFVRNMKRLFEQNGHVVDVYSMDARATYHVKGLPLCEG